MRACLMACGILLAGCPSDEDGRAGDGTNGGHSGVGNSAGAGSESVRGQATEVSCLYEHDDTCVTLQAEADDKGVRTCNLPDVEVPECPVKAWFGRCIETQHSFGWQTNPAGSEIIQKLTGGHRVTTTYHDADQPKISESTRNACLNRSDDAPFEDHAWGGLWTEWEWGEGFSDSDYPSYVRPDSLGWHALGETNTDDFEGRPFSYSCYRYESFEPDDKTDCISTYGMPEIFAEPERERCDTPRLVALDSSCPVRPNLLGTCKSERKFAASALVKDVHYYYLPLNSPDFAVEAMRRTVCPPDRWTDNPSFKLERP
jgi:hypothetical protein